MSYGDKPYVPGQPVPVQPMPVQEPPTIATVTVRPDFYEPIPEPKSFFEEFKNTLGNLWYGSEASQRRGDVMLRGLAKAGTGLVDLATTAVQYSPAVMATNAMLTPEPTTADLVAGREPKRFIDIPNITQPVQQMMTEQGFAQAETPYQRGLQTVTEYVSPVGMLRQIPAKALQTAIPLQAAAATSGGVAESIARESGATPTEQTAAGIIASLGVAATPALINQVKRMVSGGATPEQINQVIAYFERLGTTPTVGQATGRRAQSVEQMLSNYPGSAGRIAGFGEAQQQAIGTKVGQMAEDLAPKSSPTSAGRAIEEGAEAFRQRSIGKGGTAERMYSEADSLIGQNHTVQLVNTGKLVDEITTPIQGLQASSQAIADPTTTRLVTALKADSDAAIAAGLPGVPYEGLKAYRSKVGELIGDSVFNPNANTAQLKALYANLTADIEASFANNPKALDKLKAANAYYKKAQAWLDDIGATIDKAGGPEKIFTGLVTGISDGATRLERVMRVLSPEQRKVVASAFLKKIGSKAKGADDTSFVEQFDTATFLRNYNNLSKQAKIALFGRNQFGKTFADDMDAVARAARNLRESGKYLMNTSGTARQSQFTSLFSAVASIPGLIAGGATQSAVAGGITAGAAALGSAGIANLAARLMTNPRFVRWLATTTKLPPKVGASQVDLLAKANRDDEDIQQFAEIYKQTVIPTGGYGDPIYNPEAVEEQ